MLRIAILFSFLVFSIKAEALIIEAEDASIKTTGGAITGDWNLWTNGTVGEYIKVSTEEI